MKRTINYLDKPTNVASKFILISNNDGCIDTYHFDNFNDAVDEMLYQLWVCIPYGMFTIDEWDTIKTNSEYDCGLFGFEVDNELFDYTCAWTKFDTNPNCNWVINEVTFVLD